MKNNDLKPKNSVFRLQHKTGPAHKAFSLIDDTVSFTSLVIPPEIAKKYKYAIRVQNCTNCIWFWPICADSKK